MLLHAILWLDFDFLLTITDSIIKYGFCWCWDLVNSSGLQMSTSLLLAYFLLSSLLGTTVSNTCLGNVLIGEFGGRYSIMGVFRNLNYFGRRKLKILGNICYRCARSSWLLISSTLLKRIHPGNIGHDWTELS